MSEAPKVRIKKVKPYPFSGSIIEQGKPMPISIKVINVRGCVASIGNLIVQVGRETDLQFSLPVLNETLQLKGKVVKTSDHVVQSKDGVRGVERQAEILFLHLSVAHRETIERFLKSIGQVAR